ncbi:hypothetical protein DTO271G3_4171 [Paecilomyces variotii]|nr:hypothetical protein DTO271G3_4171 [Paecilomyces variotii]
MRHQLISAKLTAKEVPASATADLSKDNNPNTVEAIAIPNTMAKDNEISTLRDQLRPIAQLTMPSYQSTPIGEFNRTIPLLSWTFPTLYPFGKGDFLTARRRPVELKDYLAHLIKYRNGRFARHPRFRYVGFNTLIWSQVNKQSGFYITRDRRTNPALWSLKQIREALESRSPSFKALLKSINSFLSTIRGTGLFWREKNAELLVFIINLASPHLFLTLSAADYHWDNLICHMPYYNDWKAGSASERIRIARDNLRNNPHIATYWFKYRYNTFRKEVLNKKFGIVNYWCRYEWQGCESTHNHGLYWLSTAPSPESANYPLGQDEFARWWGKHVSAVNPPRGPGDRGPEDRSPISLPFNVTPNTLGFLSNLINRLQRHVCSRQYCLRPDKYTRELHYRFRFPHACREEPGIEQPPGLGYYVIYPKHNNPTLNRFNTLVTICWKANTDFLPCTGSQAILNYLAKYISKGEKYTESCKNFLQNLFTQLTTANPFLLLVWKLINRLIMERDWSTQEVCHLLLNLPLQSDTHKVLKVNCHPFERHRDSYHFANHQDPDKPVHRKSPLEKYMQRKDYNNITYLDFLHHSNLSAPNTYFSPRATPRVLRYFPIYKESDVEDYGRHPDNFYRRMPLRDYEDPLEQEDFKMEQENLPWAELAGRLPARKAATRVEDADNLGGRDLDRAYNWSPHIGRYKIERDYWVLCKTHSPVDISVHSSTTADDLEPKQRDLYNLLINDYARFLDGEPGEQLLINLDGKAGTGKSHVIMLISSVIERMANKRQQPKSPLL